ncbi:MAG: Phage terminase small subunit [Herbinix sp.]|jgi:uncharacterized protein YjcR|nr:Phage terminase small subunit [Herbinix sp.]
MARAPDERYSQAIDLYKQGMKLVDIASQLNLPEGTVRRWKSTHKWDSERSDKNSERSDKNKGGQPNNKNAVGHGAPEGNKNSERYGFFAKWLPAETMEIMQCIQRSDPLDLLWDNMQLQYTAIVRAQKLMYVRDQEDVTTTKIGEGFSESGSSEKWEVQQAWDKHATFLKAQSRAMGELRSMVKQYDEMLHNNWDRSSEEQKERIRLLKTQADKLSGTDNLEELSKLDQVLAQIKGVV